MSLPAILTASAALENANAAALGINYAFDEPPETLDGSQLPVAVRFSEGVERMEASRFLGRYNIHNFKIEVHWPRGVLHEAVQQCYGTIQAYQDLYAANLSINGSCDVSGFREPAVEGPLWLKYGPGAVETIGFIFHLWAKEILDDIDVHLAGEMADYHKGLLKRTGQTTQYAGYLDDGYYRKGLEHSYVVYTTGQYAGTTAIVLNAKTENHSNNCVLDVVTGLMWSRYISGPNVGPANNGLLPWTTNGAGEGIFTYMAAANGAYLANYNDWRVPNKKELPSLENMEVPNAVPDAVAFPGWPLGYLWTSTTRADNVAHAMFWETTSGRMLGTAKTTTYYCALVRGP